MRLGAPCRANPTTHNSRGRLEAIRGIARSTWYPEMDPAAPEQWDPKTQLRRVALGKPADCAGSQQNLCHEWPAVSVTPLLAMRRTNVAATLTI